MRALSLLIITGCGGLFLPAFSQTKLSGYLSAAYENGQKESVSPEGTFSRAKAGFMVVGTAERIFTYGLEARFKTESRLEIEEAWVGIAPASSFALKLGLYLVPFGKYNVANRPYQNPFIETPLPQASLYPESWRDIGILAEGRWGALGYSVYYGNGLGEGRDLRDGQQFKDNNGRPAGGGRASLLLSQSFELGLSYYRGRYDDEGQRSLHLRGADISWKSESFQFSYEYDKAVLDNPAGFGQGTADGHFALASLTLGEFSPLVSYQTLRYSDPYHGENVLEPSLGAGIDRDISRWAVGLVFSPDPRFLFKVEYDFNREATGNVDNDLFLAQVSVHF